MPDNRDCCVIVIEADGETRLEPANPVLDLEFMQGIIGGDIEVMKMNDNILMVFDEEGKLKQLPQNQRVRCIVGTVMICKAHGTDMIALTTAQAKAILAEMDAARQARLDRQARIERSAEKDRSN